MARVLKFKPILYESILVEAISHAKWLNKCLKLYCMGQSQTFCQFFVLVNRVIPMNTFHLLSKVINVSQEQCIDIFLHGKWICSIYHISTSSNKIYIRPWNYFTVLRDETNDPHLIKSWTAYPSGTNLNNYNTLRKMKLNKSNRHVLPASQANTNRHEIEDNGL